MSTSGRLTLLVDPAAPSAQFNMPKKKILKPTFILALDPFAAAFCAEARRRLERQLEVNFNERNTLIQACALIEDHENLRFDFDLDAYLNPEREYTRFNLAQARVHSNGSDLGETERFFGSRQDQVEDAVSEVLLGARSLSDIEAARRAGFDVSQARVIYLVLSSSHPFAVNVVLELVRVIHWLFATRFYNDLYRIHALVLLPELFANPSNPDYATTYGLLKKLDDAFANGIRVLARVKPQPFEDCWLIDGHNQRVVGTGTLAENLSGYADAFVGLLTAGPEDSMAAPGMHANGKPPRYNSFGFGELYFPSEVVVTRLGAALAHDITCNFFLGEAETESHDGLQLLNDVKRFVQSKEFTNELEQVKRHREGHAIWQPLKLQELPREDVPGEYIEVLRSRHDEFDKGPMVEFLSALSESGERVRVELIRQLDEEIDRRADASRQGLQEVLEYLQILVEPAVELRQLFSEAPRNLRTVLREVEAMFDGQLQITATRNGSAALLEKILDLCNSLRELRTDLRLLPESAHQPDLSDQQGPSPEFVAPDLEEVPPDSEQTPSDTEPSPVVEPHFSSEPRQRLTAMIEDAEKRLQKLSEEYRQIVESEDDTMDVRRNEAIKRVQTEKLQRIEHHEKQLVTRADDLRQARRTYRALQAQREQFIQRHLVRHPLLFAIGAFVVLLLGWLGDIWPLTALVTVALDNLPATALIILIVVFLYALGTFGAFSRGLRSLVADAERRVKELETELQFTATQLLEARTAQQLFKYELYAWRMRRDAVAHLIETAQMRIRTVTDRLEELRASADIFARERDESVPLSSPMRRPLILPEEVDAYYHKKVSSVEAEGDLFVQTYKVTRSLVRRIKPAEFRDHLRTFAINRFKHLRELCITDVLFHSPNLVTEMTAGLRLRELDEAAEPLLRLRRDNSTGAGKLAQRETTLWVSTQEPERVLEAYRRICPSVNVRIGNNDSSVRVLTRCLYFPAHFIGPIEFYRERYKPFPHKIAAGLPDVMPLDGRLRRAQERFLLALPTGVVVRDLAGVYMFAESPNTAFGTDRRQIVEWLVSSLDAQELYEELEDRLDRYLKGTGSVIEQLQAFSDSATDLDESERKILEALIDKYF